MKREGWQHGNVKVSRNKLFSRIATAADGEEAPAKPTNASKCRRPRCAGCHIHPVTKARDKAKGAHKLRACDVALNHRLVSWRVVDGAGTGIPDYKGASASAVLTYLAGSGHSWYEDDDDGGALEAAPPAGGGGLSDLYDLIVGKEVYPTDIAVVEDTDAIEEQEQDDGGADKEEEEDLGFCMVGITIALEFSDGEEDWIVVEEI